MPIGNQNTVFQGMAASRPRSSNLTGSGEPDRLQTRQVTYDFFSVLGVAPMLGRTFTAEEDRPDFNKVVLLGAEVWKTRFGSSEEIIGKQILLDGVPHTVVRSDAERLRLSTEGHANLDANRFSPQELTNRNFHSLEVVARLKPAVSLKQGREEMDAIARRLEQDYPGSNARVGIRVRSLREDLVGKTDTAMFLLLAIAGCVLLIASANLANILLARAVSRQREIGVRIALGAGRAELLRQLFTENVLLSVVGAVRVSCLRIRAFNFFPY